MKQDAIDFFSDPEYRQCYTEEQFQPLYYNKAGAGDLNPPTINFSRTLGLATA